MSRRNQFTTLLTIVLGLVCLAGFPSCKKADSPHGDTPTENGDAADTAGADPEGDTAEDGSPAVEAAKDKMDNDPLTDDDRLEDGTVGREVVTDHGTVTVRKGEDGEPIFEE